PHPGSGAGPIVVVAAKLAAELDVEVVRERGVAAPEVADHQHGGGEVRAGDLPPRHPAEHAGRIDHCRQAVEAHLDHHEEHHAATPPAPSSPVTTPSRNVSASFIVRLP